MSALLNISASQPVQQTPVLLYIFGAFVAGGGLMLLANLIRYWRRGQVEDTELISRITRDTVAGAKDILAEYRLEVEVVKRQVEAYREQLNSLTIALAEANVKISNLEKELANAQAEHGELSKDLKEALLERRRLLGEIKKLRKEINRLLGDNGNGTQEEDEVGEIQT